GGNAESPCARAILHQQVSPPVHEPLESVGEPSYDGSIIKFDEYGRSMPRDLAAMDLAAGHVSKALPEPVLSGWGRLPMPGRELLSEHLEQATVGAVLSRGLGRSYGDSSLPAHASDRVVATRLANRILEFDEASGRMRAEAGVSLAELNRLFIPRGWFSPVTPGTKFVTLGGMVASDVHGKNHHREGCFGAHVQSLRVRLADDSVVVCSPEQEPDLFYGTIGGMGLLGHILEVTFTLQRIPTNWLVTQSVRVGNIDEFLAELGTAAPAWPMTMGWIDCLNRGRGMGRGILMAGRWATVEEARAKPPRPAREVVFPVELPNWALNATTARLFNMGYYWRHLAKRASGLTAPDPFFYPLDAILHWNRAYGSRGFSQYQCVLPRAAGPTAVREFMEHLTRLGGASPLCVIKDCGPEGMGVLSFPMEGTSIAVDMPATPGLQAIVDRLNEFVIAAGGRIYLTKDRFTRPEHFRAMEPRLPRFLALREKWDPGRRLRSAQSRRLFGDK
ncbi:MAG TPA: FAD-binding oxidoreductase, partial [Polyangiaceae bacterium]